MSEFQITRGPAVKAKRPGAGSGGRTSKYPWAEMDYPEMNDEGVMEYAQFFVPNVETKKFSSVAQSAGRRLNRVFRVIHGINEKNVPGCVVEFRGDVTDEILAKRAARAAARAAAQSNGSEEE